VEVLLRERDVNPGYFTGENRSISGCLRSLPRLLSPFQKNPSAKPDGDNRLKVRIKVR